MAMECCSTPSVDYYPTQKRPENSRSTSTFSWDNISYNDSALASDSCDSTLPSPISPDPLSYPLTAYTLPKQEPKEKEPVFKAEQTFNFGTFDDWMAWDDPSDAALSPISEEYFPTFIPKTESASRSGLGVQGSGYRRPNLEEESAVFGEVTMSDEPLFQTTDTLMSPPLPETLNREGLYSTPLSWTRPTIGTREQYGNRLSPEEEEVLRNIAMPPTSQTMSLAQYPTSPSTTPSSPSKTNSKTKPRKRKSMPSSNGDDAQDDPEMDSDDEDRSLSPTHDHPPIKKTAHNMIEKRYRTNLNDKIAALRDSVPALRVMSKKSSSSSRGKDVWEDLQGLTPAHKLNKATILSKATEYIAHLEKRNRILSKENSSLKARVDAFEILVLSRQAALSLSLPIPQNQSQSQNQNQNQSQQPQSQQQSQQDFNRGGRSHVGDRGRERNYELQQQQQQQRRDGNGNGLVNGNVNGGNQNGNGHQQAQRHQYLMDGMMGPI